MGRWNGPYHGSGGNPDEEQPEERYLGLTANQLNLGFFVLIGAVALAVFLIAFNGAGAIGDLFGGDSERSQQAAVVGTATPGAGDRDAAPAGAPSEGDGQGGADTVSAVFDTFNPFSLLGAVGGDAPATDAAPSQAADGSLEAALLDEGDLPAGFQFFGEFSFSMPTDSGTGEMVANMFASGDLASGDLGAMVMSAALEGPPDALGDFSDMGGISDEELDEMAAVFDQLGMSVDDFRLLDASGLGDGGMGMHMVMDFGGLLDSFGSLGEEPPFSAIAWDMYIFARGDRMYMLMVMWPADGSAGVDSRGLAEVMDAKAA